MSKILADFLLKLKEKQIKELEIKEKFQILFPTNTDDILEPNPKKQNTPK